MPPKNHIPRFCLAMKSFKGKREVISFNHGDGGQSSPPPTVCRLVCRLVNFLSSFFRCYLVLEVTEVREEI